MDEDIRFPVYILAATGAVVQPFIVPYACTVRSITGIAGADPGDDETVTVTNNTQSTAVGVLLWGNDVSTYAEATWTADVTEGDTVNAAGDVLLFTVSTCAQASLLTLMLTLDPKCRVA